MLEMLHLKNVGPAPEMKLEFAPRLNVITGDNGLGKSFILDCAWFGVTMTWAQQLNPNSITGDMARPQSPEEARIQLQVSEQPGIRDFLFSRNFQAWASNSYERPVENFGLVIHCFSNLGFAIFDPFRHTTFYSTAPKTSIRFTANAFTDWQVWHSGEHIEGLVRDVANWQRENGKTFQQFKSVLEYLSPSPEEQIHMGELVPVRLEDGFDTPTVKMPYGESTPITLASSGIRKIFAFAYMLVWAWRSHQRASQVLKEKPQKRLTFLIDEIESHLHPKWQRVIVQSLLNVAKALSDELEVQIILTTHSPLVMASLEPFFDAKKDAWFDLNLVDGEVTLEKMNFVKRGGAEMWLLSDAFDLQSTGSKQRELAIEEASRAIENPKLSKKQFLAVDKKLRTVLSDTDKYWVRWRYIGEKKGWL